MLNYLWASVFVMIGAACERPLKRPTGFLFPVAAAFINVSSTSQRTHGLYEASPSLPPQQVSRAIPMSSSSSSKCLDDTTNAPTLKPTIKSANTVVGSSHKDKLKLTTDDRWLPPPVIAKQYGIDCPGRRQAKFDHSKLRVYWDNFRRRLRNGTAPSTSSVLDSSTVDGSHRMYEPPSGQPDDEVDEVVVDRAWADERNNPSTETESLTPIDRYGENPTGGTNTDLESLAVVEGFWARSALLIILRWRFWPAILGFFRLRFICDRSEARYAKEAWFFRKTLALLCSLFFIGNWVLALAFLHQPATLRDKIFYYGVRRGYFACQNLL